MVILMRFVAIHKADTHRQCAPTFRCRRGCGRRRMAIRWAAGWLAKGWNSLSYIRLRTCVFQVMVGAS